MTGRIRSGLEHLTRAAMAAMIAACAHGTASRSDAIAVTEVALEASAPVNVATPAAPEVRGRARPRLSETVTLGQSGGEPAYSDPAPRPVPPAPASPNVVVNNHVTVGGAPAYGYGYGSRGGWGAGVRRTEARPGRASGFSATGWEGPRRTAAYGQTPGVGGNWSPPPTYGPSQMK